MIFAAHCAQRELPHSPQEGEVGCLSDEIGNLVGPIERRAMDGAAGPTSQG